MKIKGRWLRGKSSEQNPDFDRGDGGERSQQNQDDGIETTVAGQEKEGSGNLGNIHRHIDVGDVTHVLPGLEDALRDRRDGIREEAERE